MKKLTYKAGLLIFIGILSCYSCKNFDEINVDPIAANDEQVQPEYFINNSIMGAQMNPDVAERSFVLYWKTAAHQQEDEGLSSGYYNDSWTAAYYNQAASWLNRVNTAIDIANKQIDGGTDKDYTENLIQVARIWRAYIMSQMADIFGPIPIHASQGVNPDFSDVKSVYYYLFDELRDASASLDVEVINPEGFGDLDPAYGYNYAQWRKFANSLRMRLAMRLSEVDPSKAQSEFEAAVASQDIILNMSDAFQVQEKPGWDDLSGVMSREWNPQFLSPTLNNLFIGLGGVPSTQQLPSAFHSYIKPADWIGERYLNHFATRTNDPSAGYWLDGLPEIIDPRAYKAFIIPGDFSNPNFSIYPSWTDNAKITQRDLVDNAGNVVKSIEAKFTWNPGINGEWAEKGSRNKVSYYFEGTVPRLSQRFRGSESERIFFSPWESYFLIAEGALRGWAAPMSAREAYEGGITANFAYWDLTPGAYLSSTSYNRAGTSVAWDHTAEPPNSHSMKFKDGYTGSSGTVDILYPDNHLYKNGTIKNDHLTKIITQKYIAQLPWQPLEAWSDHRRLGLPFFDNPAVEKAIIEIPGLTGSTYMESKVEFFPQRIKYPSSLQNANEKGYQQALQALGGEDDLFTPLWWAQQK